MTSKANILSLANLNFHVISLRSYVSFSRPNDCHSISLHCSQFESISKGLYMHFSMHMNKQVLTSGLF